MLLAISSKPPPNLHRSMTKQPNHHEPSTKQMDPSPHYTSQLTREKSLIIHKKKQQTQRQCYIFILVQLSILNFLLGGESQRSSPTYTCLQILAYQQKQTCESYKSILLHIKHLKTSTSLKLKSMYFIDVNIQAQVHKIHDEKAQAHETKNEVQDPNSRLRWPMTRGRLKKTQEVL